MEWQYPQAFYLLLPLSAAWIAAALYGRSRCRRAAETFVAATMWPRLLPRESAGRFWAKVALFEFAIVFAIMALARPQFGTYFENIQPRGSDIYALIDVSKSMLADDVPPSRLARAKSDVAGLINRLKGERIGLIAFAGKAAVKCPLTTDYNFYRMTLNDLDPSSAPRGGTAIGDAIRKALEVMPPEPDRDKVILLITDGDDQQSYPLDAAAQAAEQHVAIFAIGLGDTAQGARIPVGVKDAQSFMAYKGEQVWTKLNGELLQQIAMKTQGVYVPAGTKAYDLGQLYEDKLAHMRSAAGVEQKRERRAEQYQVFLALAVLCLLLDLMIKLYPAAETTAPVPNTSKPKAKRTAPATAALLLAAFCGSAQASEPHDLVKEGVELYKKSDFDAAKEKFTQADEPTRKTEGPDNAIVAFDLACAYHRKGDAEKARENYLKAGLSRDKSVASAAYYNYASLAAEAARTLAGDKPEEIAPEKRQEILDKLKEAVTHYRACLDLKPEYPGARKNIELIRQWIKLYKEKWREHDRQKTRKETNLLQFLEYLIGAQRAIRESVLELDKTSPADTIAERKQAQDELLDEIQPLKDKIKEAIGDAAQGKGQPPGAKTPDAKQVEETQKLLNGLADEAGKRMLTSSVHLNGRDAMAAAAEEKAAIEELDKIWAVAAPFRALLSRALADQTEIVQRLDPEGALQQPEGPVSRGLSWFKDTFGLKYKETPPPATPAPDKKEEPAKESALPAEEVTHVAELQDLNKRHTEMMRIKAELELEAVEKMPAPQTPPAPQPPDPKGPGADPQQQPPAQPSPEEIKKGLKTALELAPKAVEQMAKAHGELAQQKPKSALPPAEEARKILEEIAKAQPQDKNQNKDQQDKKDDQQKKDDKQDQKKEDVQKKDEQKKDDQKKDQDQKKDGQKEQKEQKVQMSKEQAEELLRKVREREQDRRKKQQEERVRAVGKGDGVDKDW